MYDGRPAAEAFPVLSSVSIGRDGRIWARSYRKPGVEGDNEWLVFAPDGALDCKVQLRPFAAMHEFGSDYLMVLDRDDVGVERVLRYTLSSPP